MYRHIGGIRQVDAARAADMSQQIYSAIERGERRPATLEVAQRISTALNAPVELLFPEFTNPATPPDLKEEVHAGE